MAAKYQIKDGEQFRTNRCVVDTATVIAPGDLVALSSGVIIKAVAASTAVAFCPAGSATGEVICDVSVGNNFTLTGTADANFAVTDKGILCDILDTTQVIDIGTSSTDVLKVGMAEESGTVSAKTSIEVRINKPLF